MGAGMYSPIPYYFQSDLYERSINPTRITQAEYDRIKAECEHKNQLDRMHDNHKLEAIGLFVRSIVFALVIVLAYLIVKHNTEPKIIETEQTEEMK